MQTQQRELYDRLENQGWEITPVEEPTLDWWADEVWRLRSRWAPQTCRVYLTFVVDPQWEGQRKKGQGVWAVAASTEGPVQWSGITLTLGRGWKHHLHEFLDELSAIRASAPHAKEGNVSDE
ncbi:MAG: hypothetical protein KY468_00985 [Armatimonadetes bacterium]|nr:hypothetical protein [Armatimonadota bacterium]